MRLPQETTTIREKTPKEREFGSPHVVCASYVKHVGHSISRYGHPNILPLREEKEIPCFSVEKTTLLAKIVRPQTGGRLAHRSRGSIPMS